ncbi:MAG: hypothetical protein DRQ45_01090, partial [Gammaproteobacteria bacterium]
KVNVIKKTGTEEGHYRCDAVFRINGLSDLDRKVIEYRTRGYSLQTLDANILHLKGFKCMRCYT